MIILIIKSFDSFTHRPFRMEDLKLYTVSDEVNEYLKNGLEPECVERQLA